jgi:hypothetical protein
VDNTGKYSSTNTFSSDGGIWENNILPTTLFAWTNRNEIADLITNTIQPTIIEATFIQFYYANFPRITVNTGVTALSTWHQSTTLANETTGYFQNAVGTPVMVGTSSSTAFKYVAQKSLIKFVPPVIDGQPYYFDANNRLKPGLPTRPEDHLEIWASPLAIVGDGSNDGIGNLTNGQGPVALNNFVPTGAVVDTIIPVFLTDLTPAIREQITQQILLYRNFGLGYDNDGTITGTPGTWYVITSTNLNADATWSQTYAGNTSGQNLDASWIIQFVAVDNKYTITFRGLAYYFGSVLQTRFFFYGNQKIYDSRTGTTIRDFINVLAVNTKPDSSSPLPGDIFTTIIGQPVESDGYVDDFQVLISYRDSDSDGVPDNPDFFNEIVAPNVNPNLKLVFLQRTVDFDNLQRYLLAEPGVVNSDYPTYDNIELVKFQYSPGQVFYAYSDELFFTLTVNTAGVRVITQAAEGDWIARTGRQALYFQYRHNSPLTNRIDPGTTNIIDLYVVTQAYYTAYQNWITDTTGTVTEPNMPTIDELGTEYQGLNEYKMLSDNIILNSVVFKPLFGPKAAKTLQATIKVIRAQNSTASTSEIQSSVLAAMNEYFSIDKWNFGDTFYFSELAAYLHRYLGTIISSVVLVPLDTQKYFGDMYEVRAEPSEIFVNGATIDNIIVIDALTSTNLRTAPGSGVI